MADIILVMLVSGKLVIAEKTEFGLKYPLIVENSFDGRGYLFMDFYNGIAKDGREASKRVVIPWEFVIKGTETVALNAMTDKYREMRSGITVAKKNITKLKPG